MILLANLLEEIERDDIRFTFPSNGNTAQAFNRLISAVEKAPKEKRLIRPVSNQLDSILILLCLLQIHASSLRKKMTFGEMGELANQLLKKGQIRTWGQIAQAEKEGKILFRGTNRKLIRLDYTQPISYYTIDKINELQQDIPCLILQKYNNKSERPKNFIDKIIRYIYRFNPSFTSVDKNDPSICHCWAILPLPGNICSFEVDHNIIFKDDIVRLASQMSQPSIIGACQRLLDMLKLSDDFLPPTIVSLTYACKKDWIKGNPNYSILDRALEAFLKDRNADESGFSYQDLQMALLSLSARSTFIKEQLKQEEELKRLYAKSFQPLKNNTKKAEEAIQNSNFAQIFPETELDGTGTKDTRVKYEEFEKINQEFPEIINELPTGGELPSLRFRKLGHHHAIGLYFPLPNCICVDVRNTSSFVHEYGHWVDYQVLGRFSITADFLPFVVKYSEALKKAGIKGHLLEYYTSPTEVFARCFESYYYVNYCDGSDDNPWNDFCKPNPQSVEYRFIFDNIDEVSEMLENIL